MINSGRPPVNALGPTTITRLLKRVTLLCALRRVASRVLLTPSHNKQREPFLLLSQQHYWSRTPFWEPITRRFYQTANDLITMLLKRKRSDDELSCLGGGIGYSSSPIRSDNGDTVMMDTDSPISPRTTVLAMSPSVQHRSRSCTPSHLPSRTFKRLRNGRPSEEEVHREYTLIPSPARIYKGLTTWGLADSTLKMLYQAQVQPQQQRPYHIFSPPACASADSMPTMPPAPSPQPSPVQNQPSLHSFWKLPCAQPAQTAASTITTSIAVAAPPTPTRATACEDCGVALSEEDAMMDDGYGFEAYINFCSACSRAVCFSCSVSNLGEQRRCLLCAGRERAPGAEKNKTLDAGKGWTFGALTVC